MNATKVVDLTRPILITMESYAYLKNAQVVSDDGEATITLQVMDEISRNGSEYPKEDLVRSFDESKYVQENMRNYTWFGEYEHPSRDCTMQRFLFVEPTRYAWLIKKYWVENDMIKGRVKFINPLGTIAWENIKNNGSNYAASIRAYTPNYVKKNHPQTGKTYFVKKYPMHPVTYDLVTTPGHYRARMIDPDTYAAQAYSKESADIEFQNPANELKNMIMSEESSLIIQDLLHMDVKEARAALLTSKDRLDYTFENGVMMSVPLNAFIVSKVLGARKGSK